MIEWKHMSKGSYRFETPEFAGDVWEICEKGPEYGKNRRQWRYTVFNNVTGQYEDSGICKTLDEACNIAQHVMKI